MRPELFIRPQRTRGWGGRRPEISVHRSGKILVNGAALKELGVAAGSEVVLYWYPDAGQIGIRPAKDGDVPGAIFSITRSRHVAAGMLFRHYDIDLERAAGRYPLGHDPANGLWLFQLPRAAWAKVAPPTPSPLSDRLRKAG